MLANYFYFFSSLVIQRKAVPLHRRHENRQNKRGMPSHTRESMGQLAVQLRQLRPCANGAVCALE